MPQQNRNGGNNRAQPKGKGWTSAARGDDHDDDDEEEENNVPQRVASEPVARGNQWQATADDIKPAAVTETSRPATTTAPPAPLNLSNMRQFLTCPVPKENGIVQCYIRRNKTGKMISMVISESQLLSLRPSLELSLTNTPLNYHSYILSYHPSYIPPIGTNRLFPVYSIYTREGDHFLMCSKKRPNNKVRTTPV